MRLKKARVQNYRSIFDSGLFDIDEQKTIFVGANEAGKTALFQALQQINPPDGAKKLDILRDYPRSKYNDVSRGVVKKEDCVVVEAYFMLEQTDIEVLPEGFEDATEYVIWRRYDNNYENRITGGPAIPRFKDIESDVLRLCAHIDGQKADGKLSPSDSIKKTVAGWEKNDKLVRAKADSLMQALEVIFPMVDEENEKELARYAKLAASCEVHKKRSEAVKILYERLPIFVLFNNYFRVHPRIHLEHMANRIATKVMDNEFYDYGNQCLLKYLGFNAKTLSDLGKAQVAQNQAGIPDALKKYQDQLDNRSYQLNAASVRLTNEIQAIWNPDKSRGEASRVRLDADGQYLKVVVEDDMGVDVELDQRSEGFQWMVSFFIVFFAEAMDKHKNAILLLDEPGLSLHGLKQREFRKTLSRLAESNQTLYTTHSPFLVGPDELGSVRVVEMENRPTGTKVASDVKLGSQTSLLPLQEALGYDLANTMFLNERNLILEGLTDYWYLHGIDSLMGVAESLNSGITMLPAQSASKIVYFATILHANKMKVAALLDSDGAGEQAAKQDALVHLIGTKGILRTKDVYFGPVVKPEIEDLLRETLVNVAKIELKWDVSEIAKEQTSRPIVSIFNENIDEFSKYKLAKAFLKWCSKKEAVNLKKHEQKCIKELIGRINKALE